MPDTQLTIDDSEDSSLSIQTDFARASLAGTDASLLVNSETEIFSFSCSLRENELWITQKTDEIDLYEGPAHDLEDVYELHRAASGLKGNQAVIDSLTQHRGHPDVDVLLNYLRRHY